MDTFTGIPLASVEFYAELENNNNREWWLAHKDKYDADVRAPLSALLSALSPRFGPGTLFRPYQDIRFSPAKVPYKTAQGMFLSHYEDVGFYLHVSAGGLSVGGGYRSAAPAQLSRYRAAVDATTSGTALAEIIDRLRSAGFSIAGQKLKTVPRGIPKEHPRSELLRHKTLNAAVELGCPEWLDSSSAQEHIARHWEQLRPLVDWVVRYAPP